jgi:hypothetical protein
LGTSAELYLIHPKTNTASLLYNFTDQGYNSVTGITELRDDVWTLVTSNFTRTSGAQLGSAALWTVDVSQTQYGGGVKVEKLLDLPTTGFPNGLAAINDKTLLFTDSLKGNIGRVSLDANSTATYSVAIESPDLAINETSTPLPVGANGLKYRAPYIYWTQTWSGLVVRAPISPITGQRTGNDEILATGQYIPDDIVVSSDGKMLYITRPYAKTLVGVALPVDGGEAGEPKVLLGGQGSTVIPGAAAAIFGRGENDKNVLYVSTSGGFTGDDGDGEILEGGKVVAVHLGEANVCS